MKTLWNNTNYNNDLRLTRSDAQSCSHPGPCDSDVDIVMVKPYVRKQLALLDPEQLKKELRDYGAWDDNELSNHSENLCKWVWISAGDISERN